MIRRPNERRDTAAAISGVDQRLRECLQVLWLALPNGRESKDYKPGRSCREDTREAPLSPDAAYQQLDEHFRRLVERALRDFKEDLQHFPSS